MKSPTRIILACALIALAGCAKSKNDETPVTPDLKGGEVVTIPPEAHEILAAITAIEANDVKKLDELLAKKPGLINADPKKAGRDADSMLEIAYFNDANTSRLSAFIDKGVDFYVLWGLVEKLEEQKINDPRARSMLLGKMFLIADANQRAFEGELRALGLNMEDHPSLDAEIADFNALAPRVADTIDWQKDLVKAEALVKAGALAKAKLKAPLKALDGIIRLEKHYLFVLTSLDSSTHSNEKERTAVSQKALWARQEKEKRHTALLEVQAKLVFAELALEEEKLGQ